MNDYLEKIQEKKKGSRRYFVMIVGNKSDLKDHREVRGKEGENFLKVWKIWVIYYFLLLFEKKKTQNRFLTTQQENSQKKKGSPMQK